MSLPETAKGNLRSFPKVTGSQGQMTAQHPARPATLIPPLEETALIPYDHY